MTIAAATATLSERMRGRMGMRSARSAAACTSSGAPADFAADEQNVPRAVVAVEIGRRRPRR